MQDRYRNNGCSSFEQICINSKKYRVSSRENVWDTFVDNLDTEIYIPDLPETLISKFWYVLVTSEDVEHICSAFELLFQPQAEFSISKQFWLIYLHYYLI